jgi:hypothetical protein
MSSEQKDVTAIRGLETDLYNKMLAKAKETGKNVSELMNEAMKAYLNQVQETSTIFGENQHNIIISKKDLVELGKVMFGGVTNLRFSKDIDKETFENNVVSIENCINVQVPEPLYIDAMKKTKRCLNVSPYSVEEQKAQDQNVIRIGGIDSLEVSKSDLESLGKKVVFDEIDELKLSPDVDADAVNRYIEVIKDVDQLTVPKNIFFLILTKTRDCDEVNKY